MDTATQKAGEAADSASAALESQTTSAQSEAAALTAKDDAEAAADIAMRYGQFIDIEDGVLMIGGD